MPTRMISARSSPDPSICGRSSWRTTQIRRSGSLLRPERGLSARNMPTATTRTRSTERSTARSRRLMKVRSMPTLWWTPAPSLRWGASRSYSTSIWLAERVMCPEAAFGWMILRKVQGDHTVGTGVRAGDDHLPVPHRRSPNQIGIRGGGGEHTFAHGVAASGYNTRSAKSDSAFHEDRPVWGTSASSRKRAPSHPT